MKYDLHIHSIYSNDSNSNIENIIKVARKKGLSGIAVTDHNTIKGSKKALIANAYNDFQIITGTEIKTNYGDVIGLFIEKEIISRSFEEVIDEINSQGGLSILAHPFRHNNLPYNLIEKVDLIEGFNARSKVIHNKKSSKIGKENKKPMTAGSDAHFYFEIGRGITIVEQDIEIALRKGITDIAGSESNYLFVHGLSVALEKMKSIKFTPF